MKNGICLKCSGTDVRSLLTNDWREARSGPLMLKHHADPEAFWDKETTYYKLCTWACFDCGYVEFYMEDFKTTPANISGYWWD